jgi:cancer susceptibility candidate protein 1
LHQLYKSGINLLPEDCDIEDNEILLKDSEAEDRAIEDISLAVRGFFVKSSKWSSILPEEKVNFIYLGLVLY